MKKNIELDDKKKLIIKASIILWIVILLLFTIKLSYGMPKLSIFTMTMIFIRTVNIILAIIAVVSCIIIYKKWKDPIIFIIVLLYSSFAIAVIFGFVDYKMFFMEYFDFSNYTIFTTFPLKILLLAPIIFDFDKIVLTHKKIIISFVSVIVLTILLGYIDMYLSIKLSWLTEKVYNICALSLSVAYIFAALRLIVYSFKKNKVIYSFLAGSLLLLGIKVFYITYGIEYASFGMKITSVFLSYLAFFIVIVGVGVELYLLNEEHKSLNVELEKFYNLVDNNKNSYIFICNEYGEVSYLNKKLRDSENSPEGYSNLMSALVGNGVDTKFHKEIKQALKDYGVWHGPLYNKEYDCTIDCYAQVIDGIEGNMNFLISFTDITKRIELEHEIEEKNLRAAKESIFISNLSHELKTPLNIFYSTVQLLDVFKEKDDFREMYEKYSDAMKLNSKRMLRLINNIVDTARIDLGALKPEFKNYEIVSLVENIALSTVAYAKSKRINIEFDTEEEEYFIKCDATMIERILLNLISNAIKYSNEMTDVIINLQFTKDFIHIHVQDNGIGIRKEDYAKIFDRFSRCDNSFTRLNEGSGIGLNVVKSLVEVHNGTIEFESQVNVGTTFTVSLPNIRIKNEKNYIYQFSEAATELELSDIY